MLMNIMFSYFIYLFGMLVFILNYKFLLMNLLSLEYMMLGLFFNIYLYMLIMNYEISFILCMLVFMVCDFVLGISLLVMMSRYYGNNYFQSFLISMC